jgi:hypothetical protein
MEVGSLSVDGVRLHAREEGLAVISKIRDWGEKLFPISQALLDSRPIGEPRELSFK